MANMAKKFAKIKTLRVPVDVKRGSRHISTANMTHSSNVFFKATFLF
jgi:hypothetical protein